MDISLLGWNPHVKQAFSEYNKQNGIPARIVSEDKGSYLLMSELGESRGKVSGLYWHASNNRSDFPAVGDWVVMEAHSVDSTAVIHSLLPRTNEICRKVVGENTEKQVLAANIDSVFIVSGLDNNFNLRRLERYISLVWDSDAKPVIILNKADLLQENDEIYTIQNDIESIAFDVPVHFISVVTGQGLEELGTYFQDNQTVAFLGSSGVGKSTLTNHFLGKATQKINETRASDSKGRHTTTRRQLFMLPSGGMLIDTPGMRELQLWADDKEINHGFSDIDSLAEHCRFNNCTHNHEPGCAVQSAVSNDELDPERLSNFNKIQRELNYLAKRQEEASWDARLEDRKFGKHRHNVLKHKRR